MLATQVSYWANQEVKRHNLATEAEVTRHNKSTEDLGYKTLDEQVRHNTQQETYWFQSLEETKRHNLAQEQLGWENLDVSWANVDVARQNAQSNALQAQAALTQADAAQQNARTNRINASYNYNLGLDANRVAQENADTNRNRMMNDASYQNGQLAESWANVDVSRNQVEVSQQNANTAEFNSKAQADRWEHQNMTDTWSNVNNTIDTAGRTLKNVTDSAETFYNVFSEYNSPHQKFLRAMRD